jgi:hypothetical protein
VTYSYWLLTTLFVAELLRVIVTGRLGGAALLQGRTSTL